MQRNLSVTVQQTPTHWLSGPTDGSSRLATEVGPYKPRTGTPSHRLHQPNQLHVCQLFQVSGAMSLKLQLVVYRVAQKTAHFHLLDVKLI